jgi:hypothetical protein
MDWPRGPGLTPVGGPARFGVRALLPPEWAGPSTVPFPCASRPADRAGNLAQPKLSIAGIVPVDHFPRSWLSRPWFPPRDHPKPSEQKMGRSLHRTWAGAAQSRGSFSPLYRPPALPTQGGGARHLPTANGTAVTLGTGFASHSASGPGQPGAWTTDHRTGSMERA